MRRILLLLLVCSFASAVSVRATVLLDDTWTDGTRTDTSLPDESAWHASTGSSLTAATNVMTGTIPATSSRHWWTYFTTNTAAPATLNAGEMLRVTVHFSPSGVASPNANTSLRFGLFNSSGGTRTTTDGSAPAGANIRGYGLFMNFGTTLAADPLRLVERTNLSSSGLISGLGDYAVLGAGGGGAGSPGFSNNLPYTLEFSATRSSNSVAIAATIAGAGGWSIAHSTADISDLTTAFDTFVIFSPRANESASTFQFTRMKVEILPASTLTNSPSHVETVTVTNSTAEVTFSGAPGAPFEVQRSIDLTNWTVLLSTNVPESGLFQIVDSFADLGNAPAQAYYRLRSLIPVAPMIVTQPESQAVGAGSTVMFGVTASGTEPLGYQWYFNSLPLTGATNTTMTLTNVQPADAGNYAVFVANSAGSVLSDTAALTVLIPPVITLQPHDLYAASGADVTFAVAAEGVAPLHYQWYFNTDLPIAGATNALLKLTNVQSADAGSYSVVVTNSIGITTSDAAMLTVDSTNTPPDFSLMGFARVNGNTTGGAGGTMVTVSNAADFVFQVTQNGPRIIQIQGTIAFGSASVKSDKTILGLGTNATLIGSLTLSGVSNVVVRNVFITNPTGTGTGDGITVINGANHIWIDHCTFFDCSDGSLDITEASDFVTVSWCKFFYTFNSGHNFVNLVGASDTSTGDRGKLRVTFHHNWWSSLCVERMPRVRFGQVHVFNNYYNAPGNNYCVRAAIESQLRIENNFFHNVKDPYLLLITTGTNGLINASGSAFLNTTGTIYPGTDTVFTPPYSVVLNPTAGIPNVVTNWAGAGVVEF